METTKSVIIGTTPTELYRVCTDLDVLPKLLKSVRSVERTGVRTSHWVVDGPSGNTFEWDTEWTRLEPGKRIAWSTVHDHDLKTSGQITFTSLPHDQTECTFVVKLVADAVERAPDETEKLLEENLRGLKTALEK